MLAWRGTTRALKNLYRQSCKAEIQTIGTSTLEGSAAATGTLHAGGRKEGIPGNGG